MVEYQSCDIIVKFNKDSNGSSAIDDGFNGDEALTRAKQVRLWSGSESSINSRTDELLATV